MASGANKLTTLSWAERQLLLFELFMLNSESVVFNLGGAADGRLAHLNRPERKLGETDHYSQEISARE